MVGKLCTENPAIKDLITAFTGETKSITNEIAQEHEFITKNFAKFGGWDIIFKRVGVTALQSGLIVLVKNRGAWDFVAVLNDETEDLYVFTREKNIENIVKNFGKKSIHYFHALITKNDIPQELNNYQMKLFPTTTEEYEMKRLEVAQKVLGESYFDIQRVVFIVSKESGNRIVGAEARLYDKYFNIIESTDWSSHVSKEEGEYESIAILNYIDDETEELVIPKIKENIKKKDTDPKVADKKTPENEEDNEIEDKDS